MGEWHRVGSVLGLRQKMQLGGLCRGLTIESLGVMLELLAGEQCRGIGKSRSTFGQLSRICTHIRLPIQACVFGAAESAPVVAILVGYNLLINIGLLG